MKPAQPVELKYKTPTLLMEGACRATTAKPASLIYKKLDDVENTKKFAITKSRGVASKKFQREWKKRKKIFYSKSLFW